MDGVFQHNGIPVKVAYGGTIQIEEKNPVRFMNIIGYQGSTVDPLQLFIGAGLTSITQYINSGSGLLLANVRQIPGAAEERGLSLISQMQDCGFRFPLYMGKGRIFNF
jgi:Uncharacterized protein conserved in archaea